MATDGSSSDATGSASATSTDIRAPLWDHVHILERPRAGRGAILDGSASIVHMKDSVATLELKLICCRRREREWVYVRRCLLICLAK